MGHLIGVSREKVLAHEDFGLFMILKISRLSRSFLRKVSSIMSMKDQAIEGFLLNTRAYWCSSRHTKSGGDAIETSGKYNTWKM